MSSVLTGQKIRIQIELHPSRKFEFFYLTGVGSLLLHIYNIYGKNNKKNIYGRDLLNSKFAWKVSSRFQISSTMIFFETVALRFRETRI
jgi:hypothetical protein